MFYRRLSVLLLPILIFLSSQLFLFLPSSFFLVAGLASGLIVFWFFWLFKKRENKNLKQWWEYSLLPAILHISAIFYFSIEPNQLIGQLVLLIDAIFLFNYFKNIYYLVINSDHREGQLNNLSFFGGVLAVFFSASIFYGLKVFLGYSLFPMMLGLSLVLLFSWYQILVFVPFSIKKNFDFFLIAFLILCQFSAVLFFLPFSYRLLGMLLTICFYFIVGVGRFYFYGENLAKKLRYYLLFSLLAVFILVLTARWL